MPIVTTYSAARASLASLCDEVASTREAVIIRRRNADDVDVWYDFLSDHKIKMRTQPRTHRDGARSFYCEDPDGTVVQVIHHPPISGKL